MYGKQQNIVFENENFIFFWNLKLLRFILKRFIEVYCSGDQSFSAHGTNSKLIFYVTLLAIFSCLSTSVGFHWFITLKVWNFVTVQKFLIPIFFTIASLKVKIGKRIKKAFWKFWVLSLLKFPWFFSRTNQKSPNSDKVW